MNRKLRRAEQKKSGVRVQSPLVQQTFDQALKLHQSGDFASAEGFYRKVLQLDPSNYNALHLYGLLASQTGRSEIAVDYIKSAIEKKSDVAFFHANLVLPLKALRRFDEAVAAGLEAIRLNPSFAAAHNNLGIVYHMQERYDDALKSYNTALLHQPDHAQSYCNIGELFQLKAQYADAEAAFLKAISLDPNLAIAHNNLGATLLFLGRTVDAAACFENAVTINPNFAEAHSSLAGCLKVLSLVERAEESSRRAIALNPTYAPAYGNLGGVLSLRGRAEEAIDCHRKAVELDPSDSEARSNLLLTLHYSSLRSSADIYEEAGRFSENLVEQKVIKAKGSKTSPDRPIRVGYVSGDFRNHPVGFFFSGVIAEKNPGLISTYCYSNSANVDEVTDHIKSSVEGWRPIYHLKDEEAQRVIESDEIDILVDLSGHTGFNRLPLFSRRPAPIQLSWLGYHGTTGLLNMDYLMADRFVAPEGDQRYFSEKVWRFPVSYFCFTPPTYDISVDPAPAGRRITFGCFNNLAKVSDSTIAMWCRLLDRLPDSDLFMKTVGLGEPSLKQDVLSRFATFGIGAGRLILEGPMPSRSEGMAQYNRVDIALDPFPYGGATTTAEALWMGVPVITMHGERWSGRMSESILNAAGLPDLVAEDEADYIERAVALASDRSALAALKSNLRKQVLASTLCDTRAFARSLEKAYMDIFAAES